MANERGSNVETPGFAPTVDLSNSVPTEPTDSGAGAGALKSTGEDLANAFGRIGDRLATEEGAKAGAIAGLDPNWRPATDLGTLRVQAFNNAAQDVYTNNLQVKTRQSIADAYQDYTLLPQDQKTPDVLAANIAKIKADTLANDVFPQNQGKFQNTFDNQAFPYLQKAQNDHDGYVGQQAQASFIGNEQSTANAADRAASLGTPEGLTLAQQEAQAHANLIDEQVNQGNMTPQAGAKMKNALQQQLLQTTELAKFQALPDAQKAAYADKFKAGYSTGNGGLVNASFGDPDSDSGTRNNNFTNIDGRSGWAAQQPGYAGADGRFAKFATPEAGLQAASSNLDNYAAKGRDTITKIVSAWSPPSENDTPALIAKMAQRTGLAPNQQLDMSDPATKAKLIGALISQETGKAPFTATQIQGAITGNPTNGLDPQGFKFVAGKMDVALNQLDSQASEASKSAVADINGTIKQTTAGYDAQPSDVARLNNMYGSSNDQSVKDALLQFNLIHSNFADFKGMSPQQVESKITQMRAGTNNAAGTDANYVPVVEAAVAYSKKLREDLASNQNGRAVQDGVIGSTTPIDFTKPPAEIGAALASRIPQADQAAQNYGTKPVILSPDEKAQLKGLSQQGGPGMIAAAQAVAQTLGPRAEQVFAEAGPEAATFSQAGRVAMWNGSQSYLDDMAARQALVRDPATKHGLELPDRNLSDQTLDSTIGGALNNIPAMNAAVRQGSRDVYEYRALNGNLDKKVSTVAAQSTFVRGIQEASGATFDGDTQYGGIGTYNAGWFSQGQKILAPLHMRADGVGTAIAGLTQDQLNALPNPPVAGDGKTPISTRQLQSGQLTSMGHGVYNVSLNDPQGKDPQWVRQPNGQKFVLDLNALEPEIRKVSPQLYRTP